MKSLGSGGSLSFSWVRCSGLGFENSDLDLGGCKLDKDGGVAGGGGRGSWFFAREAEGFSNDVLELRYRVDEFLVFGVNEYGAEDAVIGVFGSGVVGGVFLVVGGGETEDPDCKGAFLLFDVIDFILEFKNFCKSVLNVSLDVVNSVSNSFQFVEGHVEFSISGVGVCDKILEGLLDGVGLRGLQTGRHGD